MVRQAREAQRRFLAEHLGRWARPFCRNLADAAEAPMDRAIAPALAAFVTAEADRLGVALADGALNTADDGALRG